jgi:5'-3' exonuclease/20S proteasome alpha/beta subunit
MGVPKFFRWLSERYPKINQRYGSLPDPETAQKHFPERGGSPPPTPFEEPDPMATCGLAPPIDRLYLDMNGIIHGCSHNNDDDKNNNSNNNNAGGGDDNDVGWDTDASVEGGGSSRKGVSNEQIFRNVCYYLDRIIGDMVQPEKLVYMAIDGVAPRAKMNQQRSRRFRSGGEGEIETTVYEAHRAANEEKERLRRLEEDDDDDDNNDGDNNDNNFRRRDKEGRLRHGIQDGSYSFVLDFEEGNKIPSSNGDDKDIEEKISKMDKINNGINPNHEKYAAKTHTHGDLQEVSNGRFKGKFETSSSSSLSSSSSNAVSTGGSSEFHSNVITPGTPFFAEFTKYLEHFVKYKLSTDPKWKNLTIIFSGPNVPGEGEHKIMQFLREQRERPDYNPNLRHCIMGQDGDLIMLGLLTHEPNMVLLREKVVFNMTSVRLEKAHAAEKASKESSSSLSSLASTSSSSSLDTYIYNPHFEFLHLQVLRDYLAYEFETSNVLSSSSWDLERTIDDFVFLTFLIGNDFLPHLPALDIADQAFDLLFFTYKNCRKEWLEEYHDGVGGKDGPYLTHAGNILSGRRLEDFFAAVGSHEVAYYDKKKQTADAENRRLRKQYKRLKMKDTLPDDSIVASKEESDRAAYREMLKSMEDSAIVTSSLSPEDNIDSDIDDDDNDDDDEAVLDNNDDNGFVPVTTRKVEFQPVEEQLEEGLISRMGTLLQNSLSGSSSNNTSSTDGDETKYQLADIDDQDLKGRYYYDKFEFTPFDADKHLALRKAYMEGLVWNLKYYYEGVVSWDYFYPFHYGPMLSDLVNLDEILDEITFENKLGAPLNPFDQLMGCMPPSQAHHLPSPYRGLMTDPKSPIIDFYPQSFVVDMNGKRWPWEAVTLLPFIDSQRLVEATSSIDESQLTQEELERNATGTAVVMTHDPVHSEAVPGVGKSEIFQDIESCTAVIVPFEQTDLNYALDITPVFKPEIKTGTKFPQPGFSTLRDAPVETLYRRRLGINVHGGKSRYKTASLEISSLMPPLPPVEMLAPKLIGTSVFVNYPYFVEALVTAVSDERVTVRGENEPRNWTESETNQWKLQRDGIIRRAEVGEGYCGTGGLIVPEDQPITLSVRPFQDFVTTKSGQVVKSFALFELEIPLISTFWAPSQPDPRLRGIPSRLEKNAYEIAMSKKGNDTLLSKRSKPGKKGKGSTKRRKLFPEKSKSQKISSLNGKKLGINGGSKLSTANYSSLQSGARAGEKNRRFFSNMPSSLTHQLMTDIVPGHVSHSLPLYSSLPHGWLLLGNLASIAPSSKRSISPLQMIERPMKIDTKKPTYSRSAYSKLCPKSIGSRGRLFATGLALATFFWNPINAAQEINPKCMPFVRNHSVASCLHKDTNFPDDSKPLTILRGGDYENTADSFMTSQRSPPPLEFAHGTTTLSFAFQGGIIAAVDSRASLGSFVGSKTTQKVLPVSSHILGTMAGGAADCQHWIRALKKEALLHELTEDGRRMSVARASRILANHLYALRGYDLSVGTMIMGYDDHGINSKDDHDTRSSTPYIYYVDNTGLRIQGDMFAVGSGSTFALGILDTEENRYNLSVDEAVALGIKAIRHATFRDAYSGGYINVFLITPKDGWRKVYTEDIARNPEVWKALQTEMNENS